MLAYTHRGREITKREKENQYYEPRVNDEGKSPFIRKWNYETIDEIIFELHGNQNTCICESDKIPKTSFIDDWNLLIRYMLIELICCMHELCVCVFVVSYYEIYGNHSLLLNTKYNRLKYTLAIGFICIYFGKLERIIAQCYTRSFSLSLARSLASSHLYD